MFWIVHSAGSGGGWVHNLLPSAPGRQTLDRRQGALSSQSRLNELADGPGGSMDEGLNLWSHRSGRKDRAKVTGSLSLSNGMNAPTMTLANTPDPPLVLAVLWVLEETPS